MGYRHLHKRCVDCDTLKPVGAFHWMNKARRYRDSYCRACRLSRNRAAQAGRNIAVAERKAQDPLYYRRKKLLRMYGITCEQYDAMHARQKGCCAICRKPEVRTLYGSTAYLSVDHDHKTGRLRALLCHRCNTSLGAIENVAFRKKALRYLERFA